MKGPTKSKAKAKVAGNKRPAEEAAEKRSAKHLKIDATTKNRPCGDTDDELPEKARDTDSDHAFRFLDLPGGE